jgi:hypothetical protein
MSKTSLQLMNKAATDIGALGPGEALSTEDQATLDNNLDGLLETLNEEYKISIPDKEDITDSFFLPLARLLGNVSGPALVGAPLNDAAYARDVQSLRRIVSGRPTYAVLKGDYF